MLGLSSNDYNIVLKIMLFYSVLTFFISPVIGLKLIGTKEGIKNGMIVGFIVSLLLWNSYGSHMLELK